MKNIIKTILRGFCGFLIVVFFGIFTSYFLLGEQIIYHEITYELHLATIVFLFVLSFNEIPKKLITIIDPTYIFYTCFLTIVSLVSIIVRKETQEGTFILLCIFLLILIWLNKRQINIRNSNVINTFSIIIFFLLAIDIIYVGLLQSEIRKIRYSGYDVEALRENKYITNNQIFIDSTLVELKFEDKSEYMLYQIPPRYLSEDSLKRYNYFVVQKYIFIDLYPTFSKLDTIKYIDDFNFLNKFLYVFETNMFMGQAPYKKNKISSKLLKIN